MKWKMNVTRGESKDDEYNRECLSETDATAKNMKRDNLVYLFMTNNVDRYVATHLYGMELQKKCFNRPGDDGAESGGVERY